MSHDTVVHRLVRPLVRPLTGTAVQPDHLTVLRALTGLGAAAAFALGPPLGQRGWVAAGAGLFLLSCLLDRADGELARLTGLFSRHGHRWDLVADCGGDALAFAGLGLGAWAGRLGLWAPLLGMAAGVAVVVLFWRLHVVEGSPQRPRQHAWVDPDDAVLAVPFLLWIGGAGPVLLLAGLLTPLAAAGVWIATRR